MIASSRPSTSGEGHLATVPSVACSTAWYGKTIVIYCLQQSSTGSCSLHVSGHNLLVDFKRLTLVPLFISGANAAHAYISAGTASTVSHPSNEKTVFHVMWC